MTRETWSARHVYLYIVCLIALVMAIIAMVNLVRSIVDLAYPQPQVEAVPVKEIAAPGTVVSEEQAAAQAAEQQRYQDRWAVRNAVLGIVSNVTMLLIAGPLYAYHWRKIERERAAAAS